MFNYRLLAFEHLLGVALLAGLTLYLRIRMPEEGAARTLRIALAFEVLAAMAAVPLFGASPTRILARVAVGVFATAVAAFFVYGATTIRERWRTLRARRSREKTHENQ